MNTEKSIKDLKLAYNERGVLTLLEYAEKGQDYYLDEGLTIPLLIAEGSVNRKHFRRFPNIDVQVIRDYFGSSESIEHLNAKRQILYSKSIQIGSVIIQGHTAKDEVRFLDTNNIIDVVLYDEKGNVLLGIEVYHTNKKDKESISKLNKLNINIYEQDINDEKGSRFICYARSNDYDNTTNDSRGESFCPRTQATLNEEAVSKYEEQLRELQETDRTNRERLKESRKPISRLRKDIKAEVIRIAEGYEQIRDQEQGIYSEEGRRIAWDIEDIEDRIKRIRKWTKETKEEIRREEDRIRGLKDIDTTEAELTRLVGIRGSENNKRNAK